ncbi:Regulator of cytoskeleton and endocytosis [Zancudomyces culisetae]|uniref:Regulator of cytoskeleton and endocytosis n=1 Tax=Zancudomyces culisetae TaxID=1213189 RepID=A0A1R1PP26_ZANCU|nr:Regulator of cytoskeleton and endocytosis [Zancudomyces culisetae]|eukprot:OMH82719.1 Regulator of cytoskeleton and endocytosis [Zancudomyces culisetae]
MTAVLSKRDNKLLDYDRHRSTVQKYEERGNKPGGRSLPDEQAYQKSLDQFREATRQYKYYNSMIKDDVKNFLEYKNQYMALLRERITLAQRSMIMELHKVLQGSTGGMRQFNLNADVIEEWKAAWKPADSMLSELDIWGSGVMQTGKYNPNRGDLSSKILKPFSRDSTPRMYSPRKSETPSSEQKTYSHSPPPYHEAGSSSSSINQNAAQSSYQYNRTATKPSTHFSTNSLSSSGYNSAAAVQQMSMPKPPPPPIPKSQPKTVYAVALYEFAGQQEGDLVIKPNDVIEIIERTPEVNDWWTGRLRGKIGTFPGTYVRIMDN